MATTLADQAKHNGGGGEADDAVRDQRRRGEMANATRSTRAGILHQRDGEVVRAR